MANRTEHFVTKADLKDVIDHFDRRLDGLVRQVNDLARQDSALVKASNAVSAHEAQLEQRFAKVEKQMNGLGRELLTRLDAVRNEVILAVT